MNHKALTEEQKEIRSAKATKAEGLSQLKSNSFIGRKKNFDMTLQKAQKGLLYEGEFYAFECVERMPLSGDKFWFKHRYDKKAIQLW